MLLNQKIEYFKLSDISDDKKFNLNSYSEFDILEQSIQSVGIIYPLLAWIYDNKIILVDGFKRYQIAKNSDQIELPFILLPVNNTVLDVIKIRYQNLRQGNSELNALQKISIYKMVEESNTSKEQKDNWYKILNLSSIENLYHPLYWPIVAQKYVYTYNVSIKQLRSLWKIDNETINAIFSFADFLSIRIVELNRIFEMVSEIALNDNVSIISILNNERIVSILTNDRLNRNQKILKIKKALYIWRYPIISEYQKKLNNQLKLLSFEENTKIHYDPSFEKPEIILSTKLQNIDDLNKLIASLSDKSNINVIKNILEFL